MFPRSSFLFGFLRLQALRKIIRLIRISLEKSNIGPLGLESDFKIEGNLYIFILHIYTWPSINRLKKEHLVLLIRFLHGNFVLSWAANNSLNENRYSFERRRQNLKHRACSRCMHDRADSFALFACDTRSPWWIIYSPFEFAVINCLPRWKCSHDLLYLF